MSKKGILLAVIVAAFVLQGCESMEKSARAGFNKGWKQAEKADAVVQDYMW